MFYYFTRVASSKTIGRNVFCHNATCCNYAFLTNDHALQHYASCTNEHIISNDNWRALLIAVTIHASLMPIYGVMVAVCYQTPCAYHHMMPDGH